MKNAHTTRKAATITTVDITLLQLNITIVTGKHVTLPLQTITGVTGNNIIP
jgi:hypothetical protein